MGTPAADRPVAQRATRAPPDPALALLLADLQAYQQTLRERGEPLQVRTVARCIELLRQRARQGAPH